MSIFDLLKRKAVPASDTVETQPIVTLGDVFNMHSLTVSDLLHYDFPLLQVGPQEACAILQSMQERKMSREEGFHRLFGIVNE